MSNIDHSAAGVWQQAVGALREGLEGGDEPQQIALLEQTLAAFRALDDGRAPIDATNDSFSWDLRRDGLSDGGVLYEVLWHGAPLGELILSTQPLPHALDMLGWTFTPGPPLALPGQLVVVVADPPSPSTSDLIAWLRSIVDPGTIVRARLQVMRFCLDRVR
ncbi:MAG: hypothetical protein ACYCXW_09630, partial [Solirubrobacteraceae bacterium]